MKTITINLYELHELEEEAKEKAREWYRSVAFDYDWWQNTYADAKEVGLNITGFDIDGRDVEGNFIENASHCASLIITNHGKDCRTFKTASQFLQKRKKLTEEKVDSLESEFLQSILEDYMDILQGELIYLNSNEQVDNMIAVNGYTFTKNGERWKI